MRYTSTLAAFFVLAIAITGCAATSAPEPDEPGFLAMMHELGYSELSDEDNLDAGQRACDRAKDSGDPVVEHAEGVASVMDDSGAAGWTLASAGAAAVYLCPELAE